MYSQHKLHQPVESFSATLESYDEHIGRTDITNIKGLWSFLGNHVEDLFGVWDPVGNSQVFVPAAQFCTDVVQSNSLVTVALRRRKRSETTEAMTQDFVATDTNLSLQLFGKGIQV